MDIFNRRGKVIWLTGLSAAGKTTIAHEMLTRFEQANERAYVLDGDRLRRGLNSDLTYSPEDRRENVRRFAEVAGILRDTGLWVIVSCISPYVAGREQARSIIGPENFAEVFIDTPLATCEERDPKGLYRKARQGEIPEFTGITAPYEPPTSPDAHVRTPGKTPEECAAAILSALSILLEEGVSRTEHPVLKDVQS
ncbi:MAG: adenylyl-sulfate kinase [Spirochaetales bacterium]|nr:adenylyl-sulfate kinase [Leptospiraceae bacterium]MCP5483142.1 adenylyl-sulfate kinase [Spirochaetales bacterium]MCP5484582.1 adenylyl-sulfate kinase [Spirochaetales bacterium]